MRWPWRRPASSRSRAEPSRTEGPDGAHEGQAPPDRPFPTRDGSWVRSLGEQRVADFLSRRGVDYAYEPDLLGFRPDFVLPGHRIVIEYWGGAGFAKYQDQMVKKTAAYEAAGYSVVHLVPLHLRELEKVLDEELRSRGVLDRG